MSSAPLHSVSVAGATIDDKGRVLLIKRRDNGEWQLPGGVLELAETPQAGAAREVLEETGVTVRVGGLSGVYKNIPLGVVALVFRCRPISGLPTCSDETAAVEWVTPGDLADIMKPAFLVRVSDAFESDATVRSHDGVNLLQN